METTSFQALKLAITSTVGLSKDALHVHLGLALYLLILVAWRRQRSAPIACLIVFLLAGLNEAIDARDDIATFGHWRWQASLHDIVNTLFWPAVLAVVGFLTSLRCRSTSLP